MKNLIITCCLLTFLCFGITTSSHAQQSSTNILTQASEKINYLEVRQVIPLKGGASTIQLNQSEENSTLKFIAQEVNSMKSMIQAINFLSEQGYRLITTNAVQLEGNKLSTFYFEKISE